ncbi:MAG: hypothetical protein ACAI25_08880, partial [Planctomycetota bacterium]
MIRSLALLSLALTGCVIPPQRPAPPPVAWIVPAPPPGALDLGLLEITDGSTDAAVERIAGARGADAAAQVGERTFRLYGATRLAPCAVAGSPVESPPRGLPDDERYPVRGAVGLRVDPPRDALGRYERLHVELAGDW